MNNWPAETLSFGKTHETTRFLPEAGAYIRLRSVLVDWFGRTSCAEYATDVTSDYQKQLQQQELLNSVPSGFGIFEIEDGVGRLVHMNDYYYRMVGETREERAKQIEANFLTMVHPDDLTAIRALIIKLDNGCDTGYLDPPDHLRRRRIPLGSG